jgi:hypothetical protein
MIKKINLLIIVLFFLVSCGGLDDAGKTLRNEKIRNTDEFLVKKRNPLILPPNYETIPEPGAISQKNNNEQDKIKKILKAPQEKSSSKNSSSSVEQSILNRIRK